MPLMRKLILVVLFVATASCSERAALDVEDGFGPQPKLPPPNKTVFPTVNVAPAKGWPDGGAPQAAPDVDVVAFADGLDHPRWLLVLPNGDVLVAETNAPEREEGREGLRGRAMTLMMKRAGAGVPSANRITLLRDVDGDGIADERSVFIEGLNSPFGMALIDSDLYVANTDAILRFPYETGQTRITTPGEQVAALPAGTRNHHWTKGLIASADGSKLYASVGSNSNAAEYGLDVEVDRAAILEIDPRTGDRRLYASGLRNPVGMAWEPRTGLLWTAVNERDEIGSDLVPDYMTSVRDGDFFGWPWSYFGSHVDERITPERPDMVAKARVPDYALGAHTASLGLAHSAGNALPPQFAEGMFVGQHGSWNRRPHSGYKVIFVPFSDGQPSGPPIDVLTGFLSDDGKALGRPVGVAVDARGGLLVADDVGNIIWRAQAGSPPP